MRRFAPHFRWIFRATLIVLMWTATLSGYPAHSPRAKGRIDDGIFSRRAPSMTIRSRRQALLSHSQPAQLVARQRIGAGQIKNQIGPEFLRKSRGKCS